MSAARKLKPVAGEPWVTVEKEDLAAALELPASVADRRSTIPVLTCVLLDVDLGELRVTGTDMDIWARSRCPLGAHEWGEGRAVAVDGELLRAVTAAAPKNGEIRLALGPNGLLVSHSLERARLPVLPDDDFPAAKSWEGEPLGLRLDGAVLAAALGRVAAAISTEETRYYLNGVLLEARAGVVELTATDGHRLHHTRIVAVQDAAGPPERNVILPRRLVELLRKAEGELFLRLHPAGVDVEGDFGLIASRVIDAVYPDWRRIVPPAAPDGLELVGGELVDAVKRLKAFGKGALVVRLEQERLALQGAAEGGEIAETSVAGKPLGGAEALETGFQGSYLADAARAAGSGSLTLHWTGAGAPLRIGYPDRELDLAIVMPIRRAGWREVA